MVANLPVEYYAAEEEYRNAKSPEEQLRCLEKMLSLIPQHKASQKVRGEIRRKISLIKKDIEIEKKKKQGFFKKGIKKEGASQICLLGMPNVGKSFIMNKLCNTNLPSTEIPFETKEPSVGMADIEKVKVQLIELPSVFQGFYAKRGDIRSIINTCDIICIIYKNEEEIKEILKEIDTNNKKIISGKSSEIEKLKQEIWKAIDKIRVYTKQPGKPKEETPVALNRNATIEDLGKIIHKDFLKKFKYAKVIRPSDKIKEIKASLKFNLKDGDIVEFRTS